MTTLLADTQRTATNESRQLRELEDAVGTRFDTWVFSRERWECLSGENDYKEFPQEVIDELCSSVRDTRRPAMEFSDSGLALAAMPWNEPSTGIVQVLTTVVDGACSQLLMYAVQQTLKIAFQKKQLEDLREENSVFLRQVTEDFEELTLLRSMAENLTLEDNSQGLSRLTNYTLSLLGQIIGVEHLYYLDNQKGKSHVSAAWSESAETIATLSNWQVEAVTDSLANQMNGKPLVRNGIQPLELGQGIRTIRELIIIPVSTSMARIGWLVAVNRSSQFALEHSTPEFMLSQDELGSRETSLLSTAAAMLGAHANNLQLFEERENLLVNVVRALVSAIDSRDPYTCGHSERVALYAKRLAAEIGLEDEACEKIYLTGLLHDLGKIGVSDSVLKKDGPLTDEEFAEIQKHPDLGWSILQGLEQLDYVLPGVLHHHERVDGKGYPDQLHGDETPLEGRLLAVVDAFDAMTSNRTYRPGMPIEKAVDILAEGAGTQWDAELIDAFLRVLPDILEIRDTYTRPPLPKRTEVATSKIDHKAAETPAAV